MPLAFAAVVVVLAMTGVAAERRCPASGRSLRPIQADVLAAPGFDFSSERLSLYADIDPEIARTFPPLADQLL